MKTKIIERTLPDGKIKYVIQQKHWLFRWIWSDGWLNSSSGASCKDSFSTLQEAKDNLCWFDGTKVKDQVIGDER